MTHKPVLLNEVIDMLNIRKESFIVDGTLGGGGHSREILKYLSEKGRIIAMDQDRDILHMTEKQFEKNTNINFCHSNFVYMKDVLQKMKIDQVDGVLLDLGVSSFQLDDSKRGFSFKEDGPLDMRMDHNNLTTAEDIVNHSSEEELRDIMRNYGEVRGAHRIASKIVYLREKKPIKTTDQLREAIHKVQPYRKYKMRIDPATRVFQAIRISVNKELEVLEKALHSAISLLKTCGRICVISFHSLEDRIVKHTLRQYKESGKIKILTKKPITPSEEEIEDNPRSRSAKLRVAEVITC